MIFSVRARLFSPFRVCAGFICAFILLLLTGCTIRNGGVCTGISEQGAADKTSEQKTEVPQNNPFADFIASMTLEEKICQLFIVGVDGTEARTSAVMYDIPPGGYILFTRNFTGSAEQIIKLTGDVQTFYAELRSNPAESSLPCTYGDCPAAARRIPPFFAIDHEGGEVNRLRGIASPLPSAQSVARFLTPEEAEKLYACAAEQIAALGIHVNFAPLAETLGSHNAEFLGRRSFGSFEQTKTYAAAFIRSFAKNNVFCVVKHFPGNTNDDPHAVQPVLSGSASEIENLYFSPFSSVLTFLRLSCYGEFSGLFPFPTAGVLMSHARVQAFDEKNPACFSPVLIREILQNKLDFDGLIFSDDLYMGALASQDFSPAEAAEKALRAGVHIFMLSRSVYRDFIPALAAKAASDPDLCSLIDNAVTKIVRAKIFMGLIRLKPAVYTEGFPLDSNGRNLESISFEAVPLDNLYNPQKQIQRFNEAKQKGEALYNEYWAK